MDNASSDQTVSIAEEAGFEVKPLPENVGFGAGCNVGLSLATTEFVLFCNPDALPAPTAIEHLVQLLCDKGDAAVAGVDARPFSSLTDLLRQFLPRPLQARLSRARSSSASTPTPEHLVADYVVGAFMLCRASALRSAGGFDESFFLYSEEEDLSRRLAERGWLTVAGDRATVSHDACTSSAASDKAAMSSFWFHSIYWYFRRYHSRPYAELARILIAAFVVCDRTYRTLSRRQQAYPRAAVVAPFRTIEWVRSSYARQISASGG